MKVSLPDDYKEFIAQYGAGQIDGFIWVLNPASSNEHMNLFARGAVLLSALREYRGTLRALGQTLPYPVFPEPGGLLPWGFSDNGDVCYWRTGDVDPNSWPIVVNDGRGSMWETYADTMTDFLVALLSRQHASEILTDDQFPSQSITFRPQ